jgi:hypothetical protein
MSTPLRRAPEVLSQTAREGAVWDLVPVTDLGAAGFRTMLTAMQSDTQMTADILRVRCHSDALRHHSVELGAIQIVDNEGAASARPAASTHINR